MCFETYFLSDFLFLFSYTTYPSLNTIFFDISKAIQYKSGLKQNAEYDETHFQNETNAVLTHLEQCGNKLAVPLAILQKNDKTIRLHTYRALLKKLGQGHSVTATFEKLDTAVMKNQGSSEFKFSNDARMRIQEKKLYCFIKTNA